MKTTAQTAKIEINNDHLIRSILIRFADESEIRIRIPIGHHMGYWDFEWSNGEGWNDFKKKQIKNAE